MSQILSVFTPEQLTDLAIAKIAAANTGITSFNVGGRTRTVLEAVFQIESMTGMDYVQALRNAIPTALYDGLNFQRKPAVAAIGFLRFFRVPDITLRYVGVGTDVQLTVTGTAFSTVVSGIPADNLSLPFATYPTLQDLVDAINLNAAYDAAIAKPGAGSVASSTLYGWTAVQVIGHYTYLYQTNGYDLLAGVAAGETVPIGSGASIDGLIFKTTAAGTLLTGESSTVPIAAAAFVVGRDGNIIAHAIDTLEGKGSLMSSFNEIKQVVNDSAFANGDSQESEDARARRFQITIQGLTSGTKKGLEAAVLGVAGVRSVTVRERYPEPGTNTIVADDGSGNLSPATIVAIQQVLDGDPTDFTNYPGRRVCGILCNVIAPNTIPVNVSVTATRIGTLSDPVSIQNNVQSAIENYINTRRLGDDVVRAEMIRAAKSAHPAVYDIVIPTPAANVSVDDSSVPRTGAGTGAAVTVTLITLSVTP